MDRSVRLAEKCLKGELIAQHLYGHRQPVMARAISNMNKTSVVTEPYSANGDIYVSYEFQFGNDLLQPGTLLRFRNDRGRYRFRLVATNVKIDKTWIDCVDVMTHEFRSFYIEKLSGVVKPKRSRRKASNG